VQQGKGKHRYKMEKENGKFGGKRIKWTSETTARSRRKGGGQMYGGRVRERKVLELEEIK
jgi:hypothetical protein